MKPVKILIAGDLYPGSSFEQGLIQNHHIFFENISNVIFSHNIRIVNIEAPFTRKFSPIKKSGPLLRTNPDCLNGIVKSGFNIFSLANNHIMDMGDDGLYDTINYCNLNEVPFVGAGRNIDDASKPLIIDLNGLRIGIFAVAEHEFSIASDTMPGANSLDIIKNTRYFKQIREEIDFLLLLIHGGNEYFPLPNPGFKEICHFFVEEGVDAIVCHHTHIASGYEIYNDSPIFYGIGNLLFDNLNQKKDQSWYKGYMVSLTVNKKRVRDFELIPYEFSEGTMQLSLLTGEKEKQFYGSIERLSKIIVNDNELICEWNDFCDRVCIQYLSALFNLSKVERFLLRLKIWPFWRVQKSNIPRVLNLFRCFAHQQAVIKILNDEIKK